MGRHSSGSRSSTGSVRAAIHYQKLAFLVLLLAVFYNEYYAYYSAASRWPVLKEDAGTTSILFVADPQLQGLMDEKPAPVGSITRWDADRYLRKTFHWAKYKYHADVIVFLGDLLDEGSRTPDPETYGNYVSRFRSIYPEGAAKLMVYQSGDNDVGGEGIERVTSENVARFRKSFEHSPGPIPLPGKGVGGMGELVVLNTLTMNATDLEAIGAPAEGVFRIGITHASLIPLAERFSAFSKTVLTTVQPDIVFAAHHHVGFDRAYNRETGKPVGDVIKFTESDNVPVQTSLTNDRKSGLIHEINVPTCSYRMGVPQMALGLATLDFRDGSGGRIVYHNLWLPSRFWLLNLYVVALGVSAFLYFVGSIKSRRRRMSMKRRRSSADASEHYSKLI